LSNTKTKAPKKNKINIFIVQHKKQKNQKKRNLKPKTIHLLSNQPAVTKEEREHMKSNFSV
jgi:hypothetical protein